jgi:hypothetical protein
MHWNYRIVRKRNEPYGEAALKACLKNNVDPRDAYGEFLYAIHEVHYDETGKELSWTENPCDVSGTDVGEIIFSLNAMLDALNQPILYLDDEPQDE